jgi:alkanesulfonate monooxygenase SsuD/methylene tetrahydromethanopterin reductase-like flavin-dependent oxidoreductase (luciferase family)
MRVGFWPPVYGNWIMSDVAALCDSSFEYTRRATQLAESLGFDTLLLAEHFINPLGSSVDVLDAWTTAAALAAVTNRIEIIAAVKPGLRAPGVAAKMAANIDRISQGRFAVNLVSAWWPPEYEMLGAEPLTHDDRYVRAGDYIAIMKGLWTTQDFNYEGTYYKVRGASIAPTPMAKPHPTIYAGGESEAGRDLAASVADVYLLNGRAIEDLQPIIADMQRRAALRGRTLRFGMAGFVICRATPDAAFAELERLAGLKHGKVVGADNQTVMHKNKSGSPLRVGINGGTDAGLVGTAEQIAGQMRKVAALGVDTFLLQFHPTLEEIERFAKEVLPLIRQ